MQELLRRFTLCTGLITLVFTAPTLGAAQEVRDLVANRLSIGGDEATLHLEFADGDNFEVAFVDGEVRVDGERLGRYEIGSGIDTAWRALLGEVATLSNGALARALREWTPPENLSDEARGLADRIDQLLGVGKPFGRIPSE